MNKEISHPLDKIPVKQMVQVKITVDNEERWMFISLEVYNKLKKVI